MHLFLLLEVKEHIGFASYMLQNKNLKMFFYHQDHFDKARGALAWD